ncbi:MAG: DUF2079 domain-containing protein [Myxococcaceae bacterium]|jgi:hypothetical protein|nr:DUF2079 domain-containing protein [Myxococcaceae bacterium]
MSARWTSPSRLCVVTAVALVVAALTGVSGVWPLGLTGAGLLLGAWRRPPDFSLAPDPRAWRALSGAALGWLVAVALTRFGAFALEGVTLGALVQALDSTHHGRFGESSLLGGSLFASAPALILLPLVALHELWPTPLWPVVASALVVWAGLFPARRLVRLANGGPHGALELAVVLAWLGNELTSRALAQGALLEPLVALLFAWLVVAWVERDDERAAALAAALLVTKDEAVLLLLGFVAAGVAVERWRWRQGLLLTGAAGGWLLFVGRVIRPGLLGAGQAGPWAGWSAPTLWLALGPVWRAPLDALARLATSGWWRALLPLALLPLGSARALGATLPFAALVALSGDDAVRGWAAPMLASVTGALLFGVLDVWARWRAAPGARWREAVVVGALVAFGVSTRAPLRVLPVDFERHRHLAAALASLRAEAPVCLQPALVPYAQRPRDVRPLLGERCLARPGAVGVLHPALSPAPLSRAALERWTASGRAEALPGGFLLLRPSGP